MNRKERRARAASERRGDTMGRGWTVLPTEALYSDPRFQAGRDSWAKHDGFPPEYFAAIGTASALIRVWVAAEPEPPELRWLVFDQGKTFIAARLDVGASYLADSPDAFRLLEWLDERTGRQLSLNMAGWALRLCGLMPMPDGTTWKGEPGQ